MIAAAALAGCGSGGGGTQTQAAVSTTPTTPPPPSVTATTPIATATTPTQTTTSPEQQPGGAGDETPISTQALFTGKGGDITPATIRVPPFIAVKVVLHSADGQGYGIEVAHHQLSVDGSNPTATVQLSGLRAGKRYTVNVTGAPETLAIVANAEPGP
ncbi:MAG TPA: hypothetical protein VF032_03435 [Thermoleophilaceae bacterium]